MLFKTRNILIGIVLSLASNAAAQQLSDSVTVLNEVLIEQSLLDQYTEGSFSEEVDSLDMQIYEANHLGTFLIQTGLVGVRSYGPGGITTPSIRGLGPQHTAVLWNGIPIQSALNGQSDLSHVPLLTTDRIKIVEGSASSLHGSGAIGGTIHLVNKLRFNQGWEASSLQSLGSFSMHHQDYRTSYSNQNLAANLSLFRSYAENDFRYQNTFSRERELRNRQNARTLQMGAVSNISIQLDKKSLLDLKIWYQENDVEVAQPISYTNPLPARQQDGFFRSLLSYSRQFQNWELYYQSALITQQTRFSSDYPTAPWQESAYSQVIQKAEANWQTKLFSFTHGLNYTRETGSAANFGSSDLLRNRIALFSAVNHDLERIGQTFSFRQEILDGEFVLPAITYDIRFPIFQTSLIGARLSSSYRIPTFNDLYWNGAGAKGNPNLNPEYSISQEVNFKTTHHINPALSHVGDASVYHNSTRNWILWTPVNGIWMPENVKRVRSTGLSIQSTLHLQRHYFGFSFTGNYDYNRTVNAESYDGNASMIGKQLIYTPRHRAGTQLGVNWSGYHCKLHHNFAGSQFTEESNREIMELPAYHIFNLSLAKRIEFNRFQFSLSGTVFNLFNYDYHIRRGYPMPGRNYQISLLVNFKNNQNEK